MIMKFFSHLKNNLFKFKRKAKFFYQRKKFGFDESELWSLDYSLAKLIAPRLKKFRYSTIGIPMNLTQQEWHDRLDKMIFSFEFLGSEDRWSNYDPKLGEEIQKGLDLFAKHYLDLWW